uniref:Sulfatase domain-containing protein n=1 Tax=Panagrellus redivivus TaxID=6233 RepID=A0A7E4W5F4_PANRE
MDGINFKHLSKVGFNSVPNQMAALFGQKFTTVRHAPQGYPHFNMSNPYFCKQKHTKDEQYIGFVYNDLGFRTTHIVDMLPLVQVYPNCQGFGFAHTNHSSVPLSAAISDKQFKKAVLSDSCKEFHLSIDFFEAYIKAKTPEPKFAFTMPVAPGHDQLDDPYRYDDYFYRWLRKIRNDIDDAFLLVWSDHGHHFGPFYQTDHGQTDTRNAMLTVVLPKKLRETPLHPVVQNLRQNSITLISQYDMFPTLVDLATANFDSPDSFTKQLTLQNYQKLNNRVREVHGDSLLRPLTHRTPTCAGLGIPFIFCLCRWPLFTPKDEAELKKVVVNKLPPVLNAFIKSIGAENECEEYKVNEKEPIEIYEVATKLVNPTNRMIRSKFSITAFNGKLPFHLQVFFELTSNGTISLAGRIHRYDTAWPYGRCRVDEYEQHFCYCKSPSKK